MLYEVVGSYRIFYVRPAFSFSIYITSKEVGCRQTKNVCLSLEDAPSSPAIFSFQHHTERRDSFSGSSDADSITAYVLRTSFVLSSEEMKDTGEHAKVVEGPKV